MSRAFYYENTHIFFRKSEEEILGEMAKNNPFTLEDQQLNAWIEEIRILKAIVMHLEPGYLFFEYTIPRVGKRIDAVLIIKGLVFLIEFKIGSSEFSKHALDQVIDYALDLKNFHKESRDCLLVPILVSSHANSQLPYFDLLKTGILNVIKCNAQNLLQAIQYVLTFCSDEPIDALAWLNSPYAPTPTIIEAAQALYRGHGVSDISRNDASAVNLNQTTAEINKIIDHSKRHNRKSICFITGVPGAGKTLAGLNIANERHRFEEEEHAVFLSGNYPLVEVLQESLARDEHERKNIRKSEALSKAKAFIQIIHHFRDDAIIGDEPPIEKVVIFDEAQRAWTQDMLADFMKRKKGRPNFNMSEPEFLINVMDRHQDWAVIICLIGGGQEINTGEAGLIEWFDSLKRHYPNWDVYVSNQITDTEYVRDFSLENLLSGLNYKVIQNLHLAVSLRSFRTENLARFVKAILDMELNVAQDLYISLHEDYPVFLTRDLTAARQWIKSMAKGTERYGITASSGARRLRSIGIWVQSKISPKDWFLNDSTDVRSSYYMEETATEFDIQGLELDWTIVCWDANLRVQNKELHYYQFKGSKWMNIHNLETQLGSTENLSTR